MGEKLDEPFFVCHLQPLPNSQGQNGTPPCRQPGDGVDPQALLKPPKMTPHVCVRMGILRVRDGL